MMKKNLLILPFSLDFCEMTKDEMIELFSIIKTKPFYNPISTEKNVFADDSSD